MEHGTDVVHERLAAAHDGLRAGDLPRATALYRLVLEAEPGRPEALHGMARLALMAGRNEEAVPLLTEAIEQAGHVAALHADLAAALQNMGFHQAAIEAAERSIALDAAGAAPLNTMGNALLALGRAEEAVERFRQAAEFAPNVAFVHLNLGNALRACGRFADAGRAIVQSLKLQPDSAEAFNTLGHVFMDMHDAEAAEGCYRRAIAVRDDVPGAHYNLGTLFAQTGRHEEACLSLSRAAELAPGFADAHLRLAREQLALDRPLEALAHSARGLEIAPANAGAHLEHGNALRALGRSEEAIASYERALAEDPGLAEACCNISSVCLDEGRIDEAIAHADAAIELDPALADARWNVAQAHLLRGDFERGWPGYEHRLARRHVVNLAHPHPLWDGRPLAGRTLFVTAEQGVGDEVMFVSCLSDAIAAGGSCVVECDARLVPLFTRSFPGVTFMARLEDANDYPAHLPQPDLQIALGSLPRLVRPSLESFPAPRAYLAPDPGRVALWRQRFAGLGARCVVGISWRGGKEALVRRARSIALERWAALAGVPGVALVNLQYGDCTDELDAMRERGIVVHDWPDADPLSDLEGFAAQVAALDLVVSVDNSTVHVAGALGVPAWALLPTSADWRWMLERDDSPWYPSLRLLRQSRAGDWDEVLARAAHALRERVDGGSQLTPVGGLCVNSKPR